MINFWTQSYILIYFISFGIFLGLCIDCFLFLTIKLFKLNIFLKYVLEIVFWLIIIIVQYITLLKISMYNYQSYSFIYTLLGLIIYVILNNSTNIKIKK